MIPNAFRRTPSLVVYSKIKSGFERKIIYIKRDLYFEERMERKIDCNRFSTLLYRLVEYESSSIVQWWIKEHEKTHFSYFFKKSKRITIRRQKMSQIWRIFVILLFLFICVWTSRSLSFFMYIMIQPMIFNTIIKTKEKKITASLSNLDLYSIYKYN